MEIDPRINRAAWEAASAKHWREYDDLLAQARAGTSLCETERTLLAPLLATVPDVVHPQSGHGLDDVALVMAGARSVIGVDYSRTAATAAARRAADLGVAVRYVVGRVPETPLRDGCADLVYTGKGALIWMTDLDAWAREIQRLLRPGGHLFVYDGHPAAVLWSWDADAPRIRPDRGYFETSYLNDSFPANGARERQWTLGAIVTALARAGLPVAHLGEHPEPFWRMGGVDAAAWRGRLPNTFSLVAGPR